MTTQEKKNRTQGKKKFPKRGEICVSTKNEKEREREREINNNYSKEDT